MKKLLLLFFVFAALFAFGQDPDPSEHKSIADYFVSPAAFIALVTLLTGWVATKLNVSSGKFLGIAFKQWTAYLISMVLAFFAFWKGLGIFHDLNVLDTALWGLGYGLAANGVSTVPFIADVLTVLKAKKQ